MHIPDGFVSCPINATAAVVSACALAFCVVKAKREIADRSFSAPFWALMGAFVFAAQMLNFPIGGGTSGHFLGAVTVAALLGPWSACIVLSVVLTVQAVLFGDGGLTALGSNILNMGVVGGMLMYPFMRGVRSLLPSGRNGYFLSAAFSSWVGVVLASSACALELAFSGTSSLGVAFPAMVGTHAVIGLGEAAICSAVLFVVAVARPDALPAWALVEKDPFAVDKNSKKGAEGFMLAGLALAVFLAVVASPFASSSPDGLEKVAEAKGFMHVASEDKVVWKNAPFPDYKVSLVEQEGVSTGLAGLIGTLLAFGFGLGATRALARVQGKSQRKFA